MAETTTTTNTTTTTASSTTTEKKESNVTDYLETQKKKRKNYIVIAGSSSLSPDVVTSIQNYVKKLIPGIVTVRPQGIIDLAKLVTKQINLMVIDDEFAEINEVMKTLRVMKEKKADTHMPVLFLTRNVDSLISAYHKELLLYQETDDYVNYRKNSVDRVLSKIKISLSEVAKRKSRRFSIDIPISYHQLRYGQQHSGRLIDVSLHGALIEGSNTHLFEMREQIRLSVPVYNYTKPALGDYLSLTGIVRRVYISGSRAGLSFEYLTNDKINALSEFLVNYSSGFSQLKK